MKIIFTGDLFLGGDLINKNCSDIIQSKNYREAEIRIVNLEQPISDSPHVADKSTIYTGSAAIHQLRQLRVDAVNLAHNHIQDKTDTGIIDTIRHLDNAEIGHFGAGKDVCAAKEPYWIDDMTCVLGYCEFGRPYLKQIQLARDYTPGVNPLHFDNIIEDLNKLPLTKKAILFFHWGREHVWLPPYHDIQLVKKLLEDERVLIIVGMHCHRIQGYIEHNGKRAYMSLGNFLFPNFFIEPPAQISYPEILPETYPTTRQYHKVYKLTYKKWRLSNRISIILEYDSKTLKIHHIPVIQDDNIPCVKELHGIGKTAVLSWINILNFFYRFPEWIYHPIEKINAFILYKIWNARIMFFHIRQMGYVLFIKKIIYTIGNKTKSKE